ncbi:hypothetical protein T01_16239 [Trichinella spiralis]|uniref:Uncharacterized protein n=1 Tax=Trichinella spiralis TaxID=6334 RepID=A0A0V1BBZ1_TRISP|nr:hypothetical protein T01_16239 [Trichinella spiralis]
MLSPLRTPVVSTPLARKAREELALPLEEPLKGCNGAKGSKGGFGGAGK